MIGDMNRRLTVRRWGSTTDEGGGTSAIEISNWTVWANVENKDSSSKGFGRGSGAASNDQNQRQWAYSYKVILRYEISRPLLVMDTFDYDNKRLTVESLSIEDEGNRKFVIARCSTVEGFDLDNSFQTLKVKTFDYIATGGESEFTSTLLINKSIVGAFKDGVEFQVVITGSPVGKQVLYTSGTGQFQWSEDFDPAEHSLIQYQDV